MGGSEDRALADISGSTAREIAESIESLIEQGVLRPGDILPSVRRLGTELSVSPMTVSTAYRELRQRGVVTTRERRRTRVSPRPPIASRRALPLGHDIADLASDNPDPEFLPDIGSVLHELETPPHLYGEPPVLEALEGLAVRELSGLGLSPEAVAVTNGTFDAIERILSSELKQGDQVAVEDPGYTGVLDLVRALGLRPRGMRCDELGPLPSELVDAMEAGAKAIVVTPRSQNPLGAALDEERAGELAELLGRWPQALVIEDDHAGPVTDLPYLSLVAGRPRWAVIRSVSKFLGPDLRVAMVGGDRRTISQMQGRQLLSSGWVSYVLQRTVVELWDRPSTHELLRRATAAYTARREAVIAALEVEGVEATGRSGLNVWVPVSEEGTALRNLMQLGWAVTAGEIFRLDSPPGLRVTTAGLPEEEAPRLAADIAQALNPRPGTLRA